MRIDKILCVVALALAGCGGDDTKSDTSASDVDTSEVVEVVDAYHIEIQVDAEDIDLGTRVMTSDKYSFGSAHIAPAVALTISDSVSFPRTITVTIDFGVVVPSPEHPIATEGVGHYDFEEHADPSVEVFVKGLQYRSGNPGASGTIDIDEWSTDTGGAVVGSFHGTLVADGSTGKTITVDGTFHFILPTKEDGQPGQ